MVATLRGGPQPTQRQQESPINYSTRLLNLAASSPLALAMATSKGKLTAPPHLRLLNRKLLDITGRRIRRLAVFMPPRHAKSTTCSHYFPAWYLGANPDHRVILAAYNSEFASSWGLKVRDTLGEWGGPLFGLSVRTDRRAAKEWEIQDEFGGMLTAGAGGGITGRGANLLIMDDLVKDAEEALSPTVRQKHWDWYLSTAGTRLEPGAVELIIMTRWHSDDVGGRILRHWKGSKIPHEVLKFPALAEEEDEIGRKVGEALWPERYPVEALEEQRRDNPFWWSALYRQNPTPEGGAIFKSEWLLPKERRFRFYDPLGDGIESYILLGTGKIVQARDCVRFTMVDPAVGKTRTSDDVVIGTFAITPCDHLLVLHIACRQMPVEEIVPTVRMIEKTWHPQFVGFEANGFQVTICNAARKVLGCEVREIEPGTRSKLARAVPSIERACRGGILLPDGMGAEWVPDYVTELSEWTAQDGDRDNRVDVTAYAGLEAADRYAMGSDEPIVFSGRGAR